MENFFQELLFWLVAGITGGSAIMVVVTQNIVRAAAWLLFTLAGASAVYFLLAADFVGATQLIVYVGGTLVLVVFGVMLTAQGPFVTMRSGPGEWAVATVVGLLLFGVLAGTTTLAHWPTKDPAEVDAGDSTTTQQLGLAFLGVRQATPQGNITGLTDARNRPIPDPVTHQIVTPRRQQSAYLLPFEIISVHLTVVLIGAAYLARAKRRKEGVA
jgi:NADH-quinone oxidoreductase subunit J